MQTKPYFDKTATNILKGIALILMFLHHFFTFPEYWVDGIAYPTLEKLAPYFCLPFKTCVPVFCFITGYFYFFHTGRNYRYSFKKIVSLYAYYWSVFALFAILAAACAGYRYNFKGIILEALALEWPTMYFCWYVSFYAAAMLLLPLFARILKKRALTDVLLCFVILPLILQNFTYFLPEGDICELMKAVAWYFPVMLMGYLFAGYGLFERLMERADNAVIRRKGWKIAAWFLLAGIAMMLRGVLSSVEIPLFTVFGKEMQFVINMDLFYTPVFIYCVANLCKNLRCRPVAAVLAGIGKQSMVMWFLHCLFFGNAKKTFQKVLYFPRNPVLVAIWGLALCWGVSLLFTSAGKGLKTALARKRA